VDIEKRTLTAIGEYLPITNPAMYKMLSQYEQGD